MTPLGVPVTINLTAPNLIPTWWMNFLEHSSHDAAVKLKELGIRHVFDGYGKSLLGGTVIFPNERTYTWFVMQWA